MAQALISLVTLRTIADPFLRDVARERGVAIHAPSAVTRRR
jgi:hypothetical protein